MFSLHSQQQEFGGMSSSSSSNHKARSFNPIRKSESQFKRTGDVLTKTVVRSLDGNDEEICDFEWSEDHDNHSNWIIVKPAKGSQEGSYYTFKSQPRKLQDMLLDDYEFKTEVIESWELDFKIPIRKENIKISIDPSKSWTRRWINFERKKNDKVVISFGEGSRKPFEVPLKNSVFASDALNHFKLSFKQGEFMLLKLTDEGCDTLLFNKGWTTKDLYPGSEIAVDIKSNGEVPVYDFFFRSSQVQKKQSESSNNSSINNNIKRDYVSKNEVYFLAVWNNNSGASINGRSIDLGEHPKRQAESLKKAYEKFGVKIIDPIKKFKDKEELRFAIEERAEEIKKADVLIVHYGGHGVIIEKEDVPYKHRLIPEDIESHLAHPVPLMIKTFIPTTEFFISEIQKHLKEDGTKKLLDVTIDACRNSINLNLDTTRTLFNTNAAYNFKKLDINDNAKIFTVLRYSVQKYQKAKNNFGYTDCHINTLKGIKREDFNNTSMNEIFYVKGNVSYPDPIYWDFKGAPLANNRQLEQYLQNFKLTENFNEYINEFE